MKNAWLEWLFVLGLGLSLSVVLNHHSVKGFDLARDYFPSGMPAGSDRTVGSAESSSGASTAPTFENEVAESIQRLEQKGFQAIGTDEVLALMQDPRLEPGMVVLVDARNETLFQERHIPVAYLFDHYQMDQYVDLVLPMCQIAEQVVVYCNGGHCEDSEFAATDLVQLGVPQEKLFIYAAGMRGWNEGGHPVALGDRFDDFDELRTLLQVSPEPEDEQP
jgi:rhodanese-related sulfurtransferase